MAHSGISLFELLSRISSEKAGRGHTHLFRLIQQLEATPAVSYIVDAQWRFVYVNPAWSSFARANGTPHLAGDVVIGANLFEVIPDVLRPVYYNAFEKARKERVWERQYECSSPAEFRKYRMRIHFLENRSWFLITNTLVFKRRHSGNTRKADRDTYQGDGVIVMCAHCRCSRRIDRPMQWDFVPQYLRLKGKALLKVSQGLCPICQIYFYPKLKTARGRR